MATKTSPRRPARTIVEDRPMTAPEQIGKTKIYGPEFDAANSDGGISDVQPSEIKAALEIEEGPPTGITLFLPAPVEVPTEGYVKRFTNIDCRLTEDGHKAAFQTLYYTLNQTHVQLACGKHIDTPSDVLKYLLEQLTLSLAGS